MTLVRAKKHLGQHFLTDEDIAKDIVASLSQTHLYKKVLEVGPGMGVLTKYLIQDHSYQTSLIEIDRESISFLEEKFPELKSNIINGDFLQLKIENYFSEPFAIIGNFPYNISTQILFKVLDYKHHVVEVVGMFQKEVAERIASNPKKKAYGILSVFMQAYYNIEYLFTVNETVFSPQPKVKSAVIKFTRNSVEKLNCDEKLFFTVVKTGFNQRRKTLRNALKPFNLSADILLHKFFSQRAEELSVNEFVELTNMIEKNKSIKY